MSVISALKMQRHEDKEFKAILCYIASLGPAWEIQEILFMPWGTSELAKGWSQHWPFPETPIALCWHVLLALCLLAL